MDLGVLVILPVDTPLPCKPSQPPTARGERGLPGRGLNSRLAIRFRNAKIPRGESIYEARRP